MSLRYLPFPAFGSLICGFLTFLAFISFSSPLSFFFDSELMNLRLFGSRISGAEEGCIILAVEESEDDAYIRESLDTLGLGAFISESSQYIYFDDFGELIRIPLESFPDEIDFFDPRDDGYAALLRAFFVREGMRFFFLPLDDTSGLRAVQLTAQLVDILGVIPFGLVFLGEIRPFYLFYLIFFVLYTAACIFAFFLSQSKGLFAYQLPVLFAFGFCGPPAFVFAAGLSGIWELLREPLGELQVVRRYKRWNRDYAGSGIKGLFERLLPFRLNVFLSFFLFIALLIYSVYVDLPFSSAAIGILSFFFVYFLAFKAGENRAQKNLHTLFIPVLLLPTKARTFSIFSFLLPFCSGAIIFFALALSAGGVNGNNNEFVNNGLPEEVHFDLAHIVNAENYYRHFAYQSSFSYMPLSSGGDNGEGFFRYYLGEDGLIHDSRDYLEEALEFPPFPLETLMGFLIHYSETGLYESLSESSGFTKALDLKEWIFLALIITLCLFDIIFPRAIIKKRISLYGNKRIPA